MENILSLPILVFLPILAIIILFLPLFNGKGVLIRRFSKGFASLHFLYTLCFILFFDNFYENGLAYYKNIQIFGKNWIDILGIKLVFAVDNLSILLVILTSFIFLLAIIASKNNILSKSKFYYSLIFLLETSFLGLFSAQDMFLFLMFFIFIPVPLYFLISTWGTGNCKKSAIKYLLYNSFGAFLVMIAILLLHFYNFAVYEHLTAEFSEIDISNPQFPLFMQMLISILLLLGFMIKIPVFPFHTSLIEPNNDAPAPVSMVMTSIGFVSGIYAILKFNLNILPEAFTAIAPILSVIAFISIFHCAFVGFAQSDLKKLISYVAISSFGIAILGLCSYSIIGIEGTLFYLISNSIIISALYMIIGVIFLRTKTYDIIELGGLGHCMPRLSGFALIISLAFVGVPFLANFIPLFSIFYAFIKYSVFESGLLYLYIIALCVPLSIILIIINILKFMHKVFYGNIFERWSIGNGIADITNHEFIVLLTSLVGIILLGIFSNYVLSFIQPVSENLMRIFI